MITQVNLPDSVGVYPKVKISGRTITVSKGKLRMGAVSFVLEENEEFEAPKRPDPTTFIGYIVRLKSGEIRLLVDEVSRIDPTFDFVANEIERLQLVFSLDSMPGEADFTGGRIKQNSKEKEVANDA